MHDRIRQTPTARGLRSTLGAIVLFAHGSALRAAVTLDVLPECIAQGAWVLLGDVARIEGDDPARVATLRALPLMPAPGQRSNRVATRQELIELAALRGVNAADVRWSGAARIVIESRAESLAEETTGIIEVADKARLAEQIRTMAEAYLRDRSRGRAWRVDLAIDDEDAAALWPVRENLSIRHHGPLRDRLLTFLVGDDQGHCRAISCQISPRGMYLVAARRVRQGEILVEGDLELKFADRALPEGSVRRMEDALGREVLRTVPAGEALVASILRNPVLVERGKTVTVVARGQDIRVTTLGRARDSGAMGDAVKVEPLDRREPFLAIVRGVNQVEVIPTGPAALASTAPPAPATRRATVPGRQLASGAPREPEGGAPEE